ncbi:hypothetical protein P3G55_13555, partial [Leptospira sp. 96542]|nr:hypothetical protein [Leptospira sp. 96542]
MKYRLLFFLFLIGFSFPLFSQEEDAQGSSLNFNGSFRVRATNVGRDVLLSRQTAVTPVKNIEKENAERNAAVTETIQADLERRRQGLPSEITPRKEDVSYYDTRFLYNMSFSANKFVEGIWGMQVGDIPFGGRGLRATGPDGFDPGVIGPGSGGERGRTSAVNVQTN